MSGELKIAITGPDGSGKSTVCAALCEYGTKRYGHGSVREVSVWNALSDPRVALLPSREATEKYLATLGTTSRPLFIFHALARACEQAEKLEASSETKILLLNGYWYKYAASELGYGVPSEIVFGATAGFSAPNLVFCLDVDPETSWQRKKQATAYEQGGSENSKASFISFQTRLRNFWTTVENKSVEREGIQWIHLSSLNSIEETVSIIASEIDARLERK